MILEEFLDNLRRTARDHKVPIVRDITSSALIEEIRNRKPQRILEIGTAIGYSSILMKSANTESTIVTIEKDVDRFNEAQDNIKKAGLESDIKCILGDAFDVLDELIESGEKFDFVFLDGPKGFYFRYLKKIRKLLNNNACIFADNVGFFGMVKSGIYPHRHKTIVVSLQNYLKEVSNMPFSSVIELDIEDGYAISTYEEEKC